MDIRKVVLFITFCQLVLATDKKESGKNVSSIFDNNFVYKISDVSNYLTKMLADYNDRHLGRSEWGKVLGYDELKPELLDDASKSK